MIRRPVEVAEGIRRCKFLEVAAKPRQRQRGASGALGSPLCSREPPWQFSVTSAPLAFRDTTSTIQACQGPPISNPNLTTSKVVGAQDTRWHFSSQPPLLPTTPPWPPEARLSCRSFAISILDPRSDAMAIARPVRALMFAAAVLWCFFLLSDIQAVGVATRARQPIPEL